MTRQLLVALRRVAPTRRPPRRPTSEILRHLLLKQGMTQAGLAAAAHVGQPHLSLLLSGSRRAPGVLVAIRIARALGVTVEDIWGGAADERGKQP